MLVHFLGPLGLLHRGVCAESEFPCRKKKSFRKVFTPSNARNGKHKDTELTTRRLSMSPIVRFEKKLAHPSRSRPPPASLEKFQHGTYPASPPLTLFKVWRLPLGDYSTVEATVQRASSEEFPGPRTLSAAQDDRAPRFCPILQKRKSRLAGRIPGQAGTFLRRSGSNCNLAAGERKTHREYKLWM